MPLELHEHTAELNGVVRVEEVEEFVAWLRRTENPRVSLRNCNHLHTAAFQAILAFKPKLSAVPVDSFLSERLLPVLTTQKATAPNEGADHDDGNAG